MRPIKSHLLGGAALAALALGVTSLPAAAFEELRWDWDAYINEYGKIKVNLEFGNYSDPTGLVQIEKLQMQIGDVEATSIVHDIDNYQPDYGGPTKVDLGKLYFKGEAQLDGDIDGYAWASNPDIKGEKFKDGEWELKFKYGKLHIPAEAYFDLGYIEVDAEGNAIDARTELPEVVSAATAVGNNQQIESNVAVLLHDAQYTFGGFDGGHVDLPHYGQLDDNVSLALLSALLDLGFDHDLKKAKIEATSLVWDIKNATVDSVATAVGNNIDVNVDPQSVSNDSVLMGDITQFAYADIKAKSYVSDVYLKNYSHLGKIDRPIVNSVATAVGNNVNIKVGPSSN
jgi:hypothetical protein